VWIGARAEILRGFVLGPYREDIPAPGPAHPPEEARLAPRPDNRDSEHFLVVRHDTLGLPNGLALTREPRHADASMTTTCRTRPDGRVLDGVPLPSRMPFTTDCELLVNMLSELRQDGREYFVQKGCRNLDSVFCAGGVGLLGAVNDVVSNRV